MIFRVSVSGANHYLICATIFGLFIFCPERVYAEKNLNGIPNRVGLTPGKLCNEALNSRRDNFDMVVAKNKFVVEAERRTLSVDLCRAALGLPPIAGKDAASNNGYSARRLESIPAEFICKNAFSRDGNTWETAQTWADVVAEAKRRGVTRDFCYRKLYPDAAWEPRDASNF